MCRGARGVPRRGHAGRPVRNRLSPPPAGARPDQTAAGIAWARDTFAALGPHLAPRSYGNYLAADDDDRVRQAYGANYDRLAAVKRRYDPDNVFHLNPNVAPAA